MLPQQHAMYSAGLCILLAVALRMLEINMQGNDSEWRQRRVQVVCHVHLCTARCV